MAKTISGFKTSAATAFLAGFATIAGSAELTLPDDPLFLGSSVPPNILFIQDDSGSMHRESMPDELGYIPFDSFPEDVQRVYGRYWAAYAFPRLVDGMYGGNTDKTNVSPDFSRRNIFGAIYRSAEQNVIFYDPDKTYKPWSNADGSLMPDANPYCAPHNPSFNPVGSFGCDADENTNDVDSEVARPLNHYTSNPSYWWRAEQIACDEYDDDNNDGNSDNDDDAGTREPKGILLGCDTGAKQGFDMYFRSGTDRFYPAYYTTFSDGGPGQYASARLNPANYSHQYITPNGLVSFDANNNRSVTARFAHNGGREDCNNADGSYADCDYSKEIQNFANWYSYHRSRILLSRAGIGAAFSQLDDSMRVGFGSINHEDGAGNRVIALPVTPFDNSGKQQFFDAMYGLQVPENGTPLRTALQAAGEYYSDDSATGPWADENGDILECRQSYTILMSDGVWNGADPTFAGGSNNIDGIDGPTITAPDGETFQYRPEPPFADGFGNTLADVAMHYWNRDLLPNTPNNVRTSTQDPAFWQHMTTFTVGLGVSGTLPFPDALTDLESGALDWPQATLNRVTRIDDLWHAAVNGHGQFLSAADGQAFAESLTEALQSIELRQASGGSVAADSGSVSSDTKIFQASFDTTDWSGNVRALSMDTTCGTAGSERLCGAPVWNAADALDSQNFATGREIITFDSVARSGVPFTQPGLPATTSLLFDAGEIDYLRGDRSNEGDTGGSFRSRGSVLGDVVNASPVFAGVPSRIRYPLTWVDRLNASASNPETAYASFRSANAGRTPMLFVGANDGMLHVLDATNGNELLAYMPASVLPRLNAANLLEPGVKVLNDQDYDHRFFVDATPATNDVFYAGNWHTVLAGGLGKGGQAVYALDVTGGSGFFDESRAAEIALWEFTHPDLGYLYGKPTLVRLHNGRWAAVFGNGYNNTEADGNASSTGHASLFVVDVETGGMIAQLDTQTGTTAAPNGISEVSPVDIDGDFITDYIYAGDLQGNMWKFDLTGPTAASWQVGFDDAGSPAPLFTAVDDAGNAQPITAAASVRQHPFGLDYGVIVYFGTGKYVEAGDSAANTSLTQSFYGIWDIDVVSLGPPSGFSPPAIRNGYSRADLQEQQILAEVTTGGNRLRVVSDNPPDTRHLDWIDGNIRGFYLDLVVAGSANTGEIVISQPALRGDLVTFTTLTPDGDNCNARPNSFVMALDAATGGRFFQPPFDLNDDDAFTDLDQISFNGEQVNVSGIGTSDATTGGGVFLVTDNSDTVAINGIDGNVELIDLNRGERNGRRAWRELRR